MQSICVTLIIRKLVNFSQGYLDLLHASAVAAINVNDEHLLVFSICASATNFSSAVYL